uniref:Gustatory receptor n=1 Tax=Anopheles dirus TaxID=7168 RepID=A0A182NZ64_9DIPT
MLRNKFHLLLNVAQFLGFLPFPSYVLQQDVERHHFRTRVLRCLNAAIAMFIFGTSAASYVTLYVYYPDLVYKKHAAVLQIMYHMENGLKVLMVLVALLGPRIGASHLRRTIDDIVQTMQYFDRVGRIEVALGAVATISKRLMLVYCVHSVIITVSVWLSTEHPISTLLNVSYLAPYMVIAVNILQYHALLSSIGAIVGCLNENLREVTLQQNRNEQRPYGKHTTTISYIKLGDAKDVKSHRSHVVVATIEKLSTLHAALMRQTRNANRHFGVLMLIILLSTFIQINMLLLELYHNISHPEMPEFCLWILFLHAIVHFTFFFVIARSNHAIQQENECTLLLLHEFKCSWNNEQNMTIEHYISQISNLHDIHQACGMITLDMKLVSNVVAAITSIMVVLIQFADSGL